RSTLFPYTTLFRSVNKIDPLTVQTPCKVVVVLVLAVLKYLTFVSTVAIRDEDRIAVAQCMIGQPGSIGRPFRSHGLFSQEHARLTAHQRQHPNLPPF